MADENLQLALDVAEELLLTTEEGNFIDILLRKGDQHWKVKGAVANWGLWPGFLNPDGTAAYGKEITISIDLYVTVVLAGRDVRPGDVLSFFSGSRDGRRQVDLISLYTPGVVPGADATGSKEWYGRSQMCFRLTQREVVDLRFLEKMNELIKRIGLRMEEMHSEVSKIWKRRAKAAEKM